MFPVRYLSLLALALCMSLTLPIDSADARRGKSAAVGELQPSEALKAIRGLRRQIAAEELAAVLQLSDTQATEVVILLKQVEARKAERRGQRQSGEPQLRSLLEDYLEEVQQGGTASEQTLVDLKTLHQANRPSPGQRGENRRELREHLREILTEEQAKTLRSFRPMAGLRTEQREKAGRRTGRGGFDADHDGDSSDGRTRGNAGNKNKMKRTVRVLFSDEMLDVLSR
jgi:hypothetical protein